jgi:transcriptional regulator with XRE-family HTH domain
MQDDTNKTIRTMAILRKQKKMNQTQLAAAVNLNQVDISIQENSDVVVVRRDAFEQIAKILEVSEEDLLLPYDEYVLKVTQEAANE